MSKCILMMVVLSLVSFVGSADWGESTRAIVVAAAAVVVFFELTPSPLCALGTSASIRPRVLTDMIGIITFGAASHCEWHRSG